MAKYLLLDCLGVAWRGKTYRSSNPVLALIRENESVGNSPIIGTNSLVNPRDACLANGCFAHSLELDDVINEASLHPGVVVFPALLSAASIKKSSGKKMIAAAAVGYEVMARLGRGLDPSEHYRHGFHPTGTCGAFAAAAVTAKILELDEEIYISSLGIAGSMAAGSMEFLEDGAWTKRLHPGWAAHAGFTAAMLASYGFKGTKNPIAGKYGFLNSYSDDPKVELVANDLGDEFLIERTSIKPHACCRYNQGPIDLLIKIIKENSLQVKDIKEIKIGLVKPAMPIVAEPEDAKRNPKTEVDAQFSLHYCGAVAILVGKLSVDEFSDKYLMSAEVKDLMNKITCYHNPSLDKEFPQKWPSTVTLKTKNDRTFEHKIDFPKGDPENPLTKEEVIQKFMDLTEPVLEIDKAEKIVSLVLNLENQSNAELLSILTQGQ